MHSNNDGMPADWKPTELSEFERAVNGFYNNSRHIPLTFDAAKFGYRFRDREVAALQARVKALEQQLHECGQSELKHDIRADELAIENAKLESRIKDLREMHSHVCDLLAAEREERNRFRKVVDAARDCLWIDECHCDLAYTARGRHAPNKRCGELDPIREALLELDEEPSDE